MINERDGCYDLVCDICHTKTIRNCPSPNIAEECAYDDGWSVVPFTAKKKFHVCPECVKASWEEYPMENYYTIDCRNCGNLDARYNEGYRTALKDVSERIETLCKEGSLVLDSNSVADLLKLIIVEELKK